LPCSLQAYLTGVHPVDNYLGNHLINKISGDNKIVPVVMFHSVGLEDSDWIFSHVSEPVNTFEEKVSCLSHAGYNFIFWSDLYAYMAGKKNLSLPAVMLTFDDGYLDNWVYAFPILKKYGAKATIFVNPEFVDSSNKVRSNLDDVWANKLLADTLSPKGFLNWQEMRAMEKTDLVDIQSHALTHTWYFSSPKLVDFHKPGENRYPWMAWNQRSDQKPFYLTDNQSEFVPYGTPIYEYEKSLICKRYYPSKGIAGEITKYVSNNGGADFFNKQDWKNSLMSLHNQLMVKYKADQSYESYDEYRQRIFKELCDSRQILESNLNKEINFISWPGGEYNEEVLSLAEKAGYKAWTLGSKDKPWYRNVPGTDPIQIKRVPSTTRQFFGGKYLGYTTGQEFLSFLKRHQGSLFHKYSGRFNKVLRWLAVCFKRKSKDYL